MAGFAEAFALTDDPFRLENTLPADMPPLLRTLLLTGPLRLAKDRRLVDYYSDRVYAASDPFRPGVTPFELFQTNMAKWKYSNNPKSVDDRDRSLLVLIRGYVGTGKTTLAHRMMRWLMDCDPVGGYWKDPVITWEGNGDNQNSEQQIKSLEERFQTDVGKGGSGRFLCLLDDVLKGTEVRIFKIFLELQAQARRTLFFFLTSSDEQVRDNKNYSRNYPPVITYDTQPLIPERAVEYCKKRMAKLRTDPPPGWLADFPLFPFTEEIIQRCLSPANGSLWSEPGPVTLREFNVRFSEALETAADSLDRGFRIAAVSPGEISRYLLDPSGKVA